MKGFIAVAITATIFAAASAAADKEGHGSRQHMEFSLANPSPESFVRFAESNGLDKERLKEAYEAPMANPENAFLFALAYDYAYGRGDLDKYYREAFDYNVAIGDKSAFYEYMDYLIRANKPNRIVRLLSVPKCYAMESSYRCLYYLGVARYLQTGKCNSQLRNAARNGIKPGLYRRICK